MAHSPTLPLIVLLGPTASGKSGVAVRLAKEFGGYIVSADSRQVYRGMDIGTAKPTKTQRGNVPHFLLDVVDPDEPFSVADYQRRVLGVLRDRVDIPFLVGGTGLYIASIVENWEIPRGGIEAVRRRLNAQTLSSLITELKHIDPITFSVIDAKNKRRVVRALEVALTTGKSFAEQRRKRPFPYRVLRIGLSHPRAELIKRIDARVDAMMRNGLLAETRRLAKRYGWEVPAMSGIGYRQLGMYLRGEMTREEAVERTKIASRQYAKRQMTWFKRDKSIRWVRTPEEARKLVKEFLA